MLVEDGLLCLLKTACRAHPVGRPQNKSEQLVINSVIRRWDMPMLIAVSCLSMVKTQTWAGERKCLTSDDGWLRRTFMVRP